MYVTRTSGRKQYIQYLREHEKKITQVWNSIMLGKLFSFAATAYIVTIKIISHCLSKYLAYLHL